MIKAIRRNGAQGRIRTTDTRIFSPLLYQLSYLGTGLLYPTGFYSLTALPESRVPAYNRVPCGTRESPP